MIIEKIDENLKRLIRGSDLWASECTHEKTWYHYASDEQGSIIFVTDEKEIKNRYEYDAFGNAVICEEKVENRYKYTGQQFDPITQQYYLRARYYNPVIARFTQEDAYRGDGLNLYAYCKNNPVKYYDPSGYCGESKDPLKPSNKSENNSDGNNNSPTNRSADTNGRNNSSENQPKKPQADVPNAEPSNKKDQEPVEVEISRSKYPESAKHIEDAIKQGQPDVLTIDRGGAKKNRKESLRGIKTEKGKDRDEYPPAMFEEGGEGADVQLIGSSDNRGSGSTLGNQLREFPDGTKVKIVVKD